MRVIYETPPVQASFTDPRTRSTVTGCASFRVYMFEPDEELPALPTVEATRSQIRRLSELRAHAGHGQPFPRPSWNGCPTMPSCASPGASVRRRSRIYEAPHAVDNSRDRFRQASQQPLSSRITHHLSDFGFRPHLWRPRRSASASRSRSRCRASPSISSVQPFTDTAMWPWLVGSPTAAGAARRGCARRRSRTSSGSASPVVRAGPRHPDFAGGPDCDRPCPPVGARRTHPPFRLAYHAPLAAEPASASVSPRLRRVLDAWDPFPA